MCVTSIKPAAPNVVVNPCVRLRFAYDSLARRGRKSSPAGGTHAMRPCHFCRKYRKCLGVWSPHDHVVAWGVTMWSKPQLITINVCRHTPKRAIDVFELDRSTFSCFFALSNRKRMASSSGGTRFVLYQYPEARAILGRYDNNTHFYHNFATTFRHKFRCTFYVNYHIWVCSSRAL